MSNLPTVQALYQAFGSGDGVAFSSHLAEDVEWEAWADNQAASRPEYGCNRGTPDLWTFNDEGKVARLRHYVDTAKHIQAFRG